ncbi:MAG: site-2 protease family protein [Oscillatoriaceae cyanobacterium Prado104]|jgi:membrane-associated protease RseP (regulator of RpoE activity)|nr:site-2 protease family protein [Oscillatoriaceae cyanobacterium Prado104]
MMALFVIVLLYSWLYFSIFCHEIGHFIFAKLAGMSPYLVNIGTGYKFLKLRLFKARFEFGILPSGGLTQARHLTLDRMKLRVILFASGGAFANFILLLLLIKLLIIQGDRADPIILIPICIEVLSLFGSLVPRKIIMYQQNLASDGQSILTALFTNYRQVYRDVFAAYNQQLYRYTNQPKILPKTFLDNDVKTVQIFIEACIKLYNYRDFEGAVELFGEVLKFKKISKPEKAFILDNLASFVVMQGGHKKHLKEADRWSQAAIKLASQSKTLKATRGAILIELGRHEEGKQLLLPSIEPENEALDIAVSSCYLAKAEYFLGNTEKVNEWLAHAKKINNPEANKVLKRIQKEINECG